eukprot:2274870-Alexandrium_andersonii.AAC.1
MARPKPRARQLGDCLAELFLPRLDHRAKHAGRRLTPGTQVAPARGLQRVERGGICPPDHVVEH